MPQLYNSTEVSFKPRQAGQLNEQQLPIRRMLSVCSELETEIFISAVIHGSVFNLRSSSI